MLSKDESDYYVLLVTDNPVADTQIAQLHAQLYKYTEDIDGDGKKELLIEMVTGRWNSCSLELRRFNFQSSSLTSQFIVVVIPGQCKPVGQRSTLGLPWCTMDNLSANAGDSG